MVAVIKFSSSLRTVLNYNENKLKQDTGLKDENGNPIKKAELIHASGFVKDTEHLGFTDKLMRLQKQMSLHETRKKSVAHISLNFDKTEKLNKETLKQIADAYMEKIGFGAQPYLVYQHHDAAHPHIHIISTIIKNDGRPIETHNIGKKFSEPARRDIEKLFGLVEAAKHQHKEVFQLPPVNAQKIQYGKNETKRAITNVLDVVLQSYKYTSLSELNAILKQYNVLADAGSENSRLQKNKGLVYRVLDENGNKIGAPVKASAIYSKPGLKFLESLFSKNEELRKPFKQRIKNAVDLTLAKPSVKTMDEFQKALQRDKIQLVIRRNSEGRIYGLTFIDHKSKAVFNGSDLGKGYSAAGIEEKLLKEAVQTAREVQKLEQSQPALPAHKKPARQTLRDKAQRQDISFNPPISINQMTADAGTGDGLLKELIKPDNIEAVPSELKRNRKRKRKRLHL